MNPNSKRIQRRRSVRLQFDPVLDSVGPDARLSYGVSSVISVGDTLWACHDETVTLERLTLDAEAPRGMIRYSRHRQFALADFIELPMERRGRNRMSEADLEGLAWCDGYLWIVGSHSVRRGEVAGVSARAALAAVAKTSRAGNRYLLARIPMVERDGEFVLQRRVDAATDDHADGAGCRSAARLPGTTRGDLLTDALAGDAHLALSLPIPGKDNGFDIEGLAAAPGGRLFIGLRGPLLRGWACVLELEVGVHRKHDDRLTLRDINPGNPANPRCPSYRKHLLDLRGEAVRDLCMAGRDLLILTGPPMRGDGRTRIVCWRNVLSSRSERVVPHERLETLLTLPHDDEHGHAEGLAVLPRRPDGRLRVLVVYDSVPKKRQLAQGGLASDMFTLS